MPQLSTEQKVESDLSAFESWKASSSSPCNAEKIALLDVDETLIKSQAFDIGSRDFVSIPDEALNLPLISALKKSKITDVYLFTDMSLQPYPVKERQLLVGRLVKEGFTVHGAITPIDCVIGIDGMKEFMEQMHEKGHADLDKIEDDILYRIIVSSTYLDIHLQVTRRQNISNPVEFWLGRGFLEASKNITQANEQYPIGPAKGFLKLKTRLDKLNLPIKEKKSEHVKYEMYRLFLQQKPDSVKQILFFDDSYDALKACVTVQDQLSTTLAVDTQLKAISVNTRTDTEDNYLKGIQTTHKARMQNMLINFLNGRMKVQQCNEVFSTEYKNPQLNTHTNPCRDRLFGIHNTKSWRATVSTIRDSAFKKLEAELKKMPVVTVQNLEARIEYLKDARAMDIFKVHRNNYMLVGAFGRTNTVKKIDKLLALEIYLKNAINKTSNKLG